MTAAEAIKFTLQPHGLLDWVGFVFILGIVGFAWFAPVKTGCPPAAKIGDAEMMTTEKRWHYDHTCCNCGITFDDELEWSHRSGWGRSCEPCALKMNADKGQWQNGMPQWMTGGRFQDRCVAPDGTDLGAKMIDRGPVCTKQEG